MMSINLELILRVETTLKLNMIDGEGVEYLDESDVPGLDEREIHFIRMEGIVKELNMDLGPTQIFALKESIIPSPDREISDWIITDFDDHLLGNPHMVEGK